MNTFLHAITCDYPSSIFTPAEAEAEKNWELESNFIATAVAWRDFPAYDRWDGIPW